MIQKEYGTSLKSAQWAGVIDVLMSAEHVILTTHMNSDGDGLGSEAALARVLRELGKKVSIVNPTDVPPNYRFLAESADIGTFVPDSEESIQEIALADLVILLDANLRERMGPIWQHVEFGREVGRLKVLCIDHHLDPEDFADIMVCETYASSTGELVYDLVRALEEHTGRELITPCVATGIYVALMTDTGSFRFPKTTPYVYHIAGDLVEAGADPNDIYDRVYNSLSLPALKLLGAALGEIRLLEHERVSWLLISQDMLKATGSRLFDTDLIVRYLLSIETVCIAVLMVEMQDGRTKVSFRSRGDIYVNEIAAVFGGGGHKNAAGCMLDYCPEKAGRVILSEVRSCLERNCKTTVI
ncbi:MAG TPA: bifunctional oligoribonuclease/PAP phosphatase NrnA [Prosthecochloris aestuarii]|uniref:Bifunctional oligoribonuclease/PAP phosphatase NrnA n=1 Tax=Prosthecochloris aestuarii TaxID=1102 RepID=A0A831WPH6_PROAE|nr:bifunctional oligoribonuclease/PAP phosphatase NrnA [Prosthecochloris aestuarii]